MSPRIEAGRLTAEIAIENRGGRAADVTLTLEGSLGHRQLRVRTPAPFDDAHRVVDRQRLCEHDDEGLYERIELARQDHEQQDERAHRLHRHGHEVGVELRRHAVEDAEHHVGDEGRCHDRRADPPGGERQQRLAVRHHARRRGATAGPGR